MIEIPAECLTSRSGDSAKVTELCSVLATLTPEELHAGVRVEWPARMAVAAIESSRIIRPLLLDPLSGDDWLRAIHGPEVLAIEARELLRDALRNLRRSRVVAAELVAESYR